MSEEIKIFNNEQRLHFETKLDDGEYGFIEYRWHKGALVLMHTSVPEKYEGKGIASALAKFALDHARNKKLKLIVYCPYVRGYMKRHTEYDDLLLKEDDQ
ncbi:MAG: GNAT family N-acetyltransferase [Bacteroidota bacterium]